ncbi:formate/nitrite transporter family protein [Salarchaeum japonicum]|uniref:formate/nitrite transporter family protein n=1 Tax=Salarchaeum japonicum TaxID=555573 RepID=UPI003C72789F
MTDSDAPVDKKSQTDILAVQIEEGLDELERPAGALFLSAVSAGLDIGFGPFFMAVVLTLVGGALSDPVTTLLVANAYTFGFVFVILGRTELFTEHTTLAVLPVLDGHASVRRLARLWGLVYAGNVLAGAVFAAAMVVLAPAYGVVDPAAFEHLARPLVSHPPLVLLMGGVLAGWLMGLLSWLITAADSTLSRIVLVWLVTMGIGLAHLPHSIAGNVEVLAAVLSSSVAVSTYVGFLLLATAGNVVGGTLFVALLKYGYVVRGEE